MKFFSIGSVSVLSKAKYNFAFEILAMVTLKEAPGILLHCHAYSLINNEEFILLYDGTKLANPEFPYRMYAPFDPENFF